MNNDDVSDKKMTFIADRELKKDITDFKKEMHIKTNSETIRQLIMKGLEADRRQKRESRY